MRHGSDAMIGNAARYGNYAMEHLINTILSNGGKRKNLEVKIFGGGRIIPILTDVGARNIAFILDYIDQEGLSLLAKDLGDIYPRKVIYFPKTGKVGMKKFKICIMTPLLIVNVNTPEILRIYLLRAMLNCFSLIQKIK